MRLDLLSGILLAGILAATTGPLNAANDVTFPYEATVEADDCYVRGGPGSKYYPTSRLKRGDRVVVHRHDPGGWHMIAPPKGSFSWVPAKYVDRTAADRGTINTSHVAVRVGSFESDIRDLFQRKLAEGDEVQILGEKQLASDSAKGTEELWYRIAPPRGEWRWVPGQSLSLAPRSGVRESRGDDPFEMPVASAPPGTTNEVDDFEKPIPSASNRDYLANDELANSLRTGRDAGGGSDLVERPLVRRAGKAPPQASRPAATDRGLDARLEELDRLDARFRSILDKDPLEWDFAQLDADYRALLETVESPNVRAMISTRLARIDQYRKSREEHEELARDSAETLRRDAELAERQRQLEAQLTTRKKPRYEGAGIVQRAALNYRGAPRHVLIAPTGRVLAYLVPAAGVNLDAWLGRAAGINGSRVPHPDLRADLITVTRLSPVRLVP